MCMELLTASNNGWKPTFTMVDVITHVFLALSERERPARLDSKWNAKYGISEAIEAYKRVAGTHKWKEPRTFGKL